MKLSVGNLVRTGLAVALLGAASTSPSFAADKQISIGYQLMLNPMKVAIANKTFEKATGYDINWVRFTAGGEAARGLAAGAVDITVIGSVGITTAVSSGVPAKLFWVQEGINKNERLVVRKDIKTSEDLVGKKIGVSLGSTSQLDLFYYLKNQGIKDKVNVIYMDLPSIVAAWKRGDIDGGFIWPPALFVMLEDGHSLTDSGAVCEELSICTFDGMMVNTEWANAHPDFMWKFIQALNKVNQRYVQNPDKWTADSDMVKKIAKVSGAGPEVVVKALKNYSFPSMEEQISDKWLGEGAVKSLAQSAEWLKKLGVLPKPLDGYEDAVTTKWIEMALSKSDQATN